MIYSPAGWILGGGFLLWAAYELAGAAATREPLVVPGAEQQVR